MRLYIHAYYRDALWHSHVSPERDIVFRSAERHLRQELCFAPTPENVAWLVNVRLLGVDTLDKPVKAPEDVTVTVLPEREMF